MKLENLVKPLKILDEEISRPYARLVKKWEDKGHSRYSLSGACDALNFSLASIARNVFPQELKDIASYFALPVGASSAQSILGIIRGESSGSKEQNGKQIIKSPILYSINKLGKAIRMPELISGIGFAGKGTYDIYDYFKNGNPTLNDGINNLIFGTSLISNASAWYIRDSDPKVLDRKSVFETAYDKVKKKIEGLIPSPQPIPDFKPAYADLRNS